MNLVNILESIFLLNKKDSNAALLCIDFTKAFDTISHDFVPKVLAWFNFPPSFISMIKTISTGRTGHILTPGGTSPPFPFECGSAQGDGPSPLIFNLCVEILNIALLNSKVSPTILNDVTLRDNITKRS